MRTSGIAAEAERQQAGGINPLDSAALLEEWPT